MLYLVLSRLLYKFQCVSVFFVLGGVGLGTEWGWGPTESCCQIWSATGSHYFDSGWLSFIFTLKLLLCMLNRINYTLAITCTKGKVCLSINFFFFHVFFYDFFMIFLYIYCSFSNAKTVALVVAFTSTWTTHWQSQLKIESNRLLKI